MQPADVFYRMYEALDQDAVLRDPGDAQTINVDLNLGYTKLISGSGAETRTLANPGAPGVFYGLFLDVDGGGDITLTVTDGFNKNGDTTLTFADVGDFALFYSTEEGTSLRWRILGSHALSAAPTAIDAALTDSTGGTTDGEIDSLTGTYAIDDSTIEDNFAELAKSIESHRVAINEILAALQLSSITA